MSGQRQHPSNRGISLLACLLAVVVLVPAADLLAASARKPDIVFILADELSWSDLGCYDHAFSSDA